MPKQCDNKSVGVIIRDGDKFAVIKRKNYPVSFAFVAGHLDGDTPEDAARKEAKEEVKITVLTLEKKFEGQLPNPCKRDGGDGHYWYVFEAVRWEGELEAGSDAKEALWKSVGELKELKRRTEVIADKLGIPVRELAGITPVIVEDSEWKKEPGLEPVWVVILEKMGIF